MRKGITRLLAAIGLSGTRGPRYPTRVARMSDGACPINAPAPRSEADDMRELLREALRAGAYLATTVSMLVNPDDVDRDEVGFVWHGVFGGGEFLEAPVLEHESAVRWQRLVNRIRARYPDLMP